ncbi:MAG: hypothetical protein JRJ08_05335 [Deltaproteobacteria bacterium]|nr:hypothetical protein [Deltaproteobacteria bacterium]
MQKQCLSRITIIVFILLFTQFPPSSGEASSLRRDPVVKAVEAARPAVVNISTEQVVRRKANSFSPFSMDPFFDQFFENFFEPRYEKKYTQNSLGSGIIFGKSGYILTNWHVIERTSRIKIILINEKMYEAKINGKI